jgi:hypothetical protein
MFFGGRGGYKPLKFTSTKRPPHDSVSEPMLFDLPLFHLYPNLTSTIKVFFTLVHCACVGDVYGSVREPILFNLLSTLTLMINPIAILAYSSFLLKN